MKIFLTRVLLVLLISALPIAVYIIFHSSLIKVFPNDNARHFSIREYLDNPPEKAQVIFFGSSLGMFGVDAAVLDSLDGEKQYINLCTSGQTTSELVHFLEDLPPGTKEVLFCQPYYFIQGDEPYPLPENKAVSLSLARFKTGRFEYGFNSEFDNKANLYPSNIIAASLNFRSSLHISLRSILDKHQNQEFSWKTFWSLKHPFYYNSERSYNYNQKKPSSPEKLTITLGQQKLDTHNKISEYLAERKIKYTVVMMPMNSDFYDYSDADKTVNELRRTARFEIINLTGAVSADDFYDIGHVNRRGSTILTQMLWNDYFNTTR